MDVSGFQVVLTCESFRGQSEGFLDVCCISRHWHRIRKFKKLSPRLIRTRIELFLHASTLARLIILAAWLKWLHYIFFLSSLFSHIYAWYYYSPFSDDILVTYRNHLPNFGGLKQLLIIICLDFCWLAGSPWVVLPWSLTCSCNQMAAGAGVIKTEHLSGFFIHVSDASVKRMRTAGSRLNICISTQPLLVGLPPSIIEQIDGLLNDYWLPQSSAL